MASTKAKRRSTATKASSSSSRSKGSKKAGSKTGSTPKVAKKTSSSKNNRNQVMSKMKPNEDSVPPNTNQCFTHEDDTIEHHKPGYAKPGQPKRWYVHGVLPHLQGVRHPNDRAKDPSSSLGMLNPFAVALRKAALGSSYKPLADTSAWKLLFDSAMDGNLEVFESTLDAIGYNDAPNPLQAAACLAAGYSRHDILRSCLEKGAKFDRDLAFASLCGATTPEMLDVMFDHDWRKIRTSITSARTEIDKLKNSEPKWKARYLKELCYPPDYDEWEHDPNNPKNFKKYTEDGFYSAQYVMKHLPDLA